MKAVRITCGTYGYRRPDGRLEPARAGTIINVPDDEAERIIKRKVGVVVASEGVATPPADTGDSGAGTNTPAPETPGEPPVTGHRDPEHLKTMTNAALTQLAVDMGADPAALKGKNKAQLIEIITAIEVSVPVDEAGNDPEDDGEGDGEEPPKGEVAAPVE